MNAKLLDRIYKNVKNNAIRYWHRVWLTHKFYHDRRLVSTVNGANQDVVHAFLHLRESALDSAIISFGRGFLDQGDDSLSLTRLLPSTSEHLRKNKTYRLNEEEKACSILYGQWYSGNKTDGIFIESWFCLAELLAALRNSQEVRQMLQMRNAMVAHSLAKGVSAPPAFAMLYTIRDELVRVMNYTSLLFEHETTKWDVYLSQCESSAIGFGKVLTAGTV